MTAEPFAAKKWSQEAQPPLRAAIAGGGNSCHELLTLLEKAQFHAPVIKILGVFDQDPDAPGLQYAKQKNLFTTTNIEELLGLENLDLIIELSESATLKDKIWRKLPTGVSLIDSKGVSLLRNILRTQTSTGPLPDQIHPQVNKDEEHTQVILDSLPYRIMVVGLDMKVHRVNKTFLREYGHSYEDVLGKPCYEVRYGLDRPCSEFGRECSLIDHLEIIKKKGLVSTYQEYKDKNGETRFDVITIAPIFNEDGEVVQILEASRDDTERIRLQREAQKSNTFFEKVIQSTVDGIVVVDTKGNVLIFNEGMEHLTGYSAREIIDRGHLSSFYDIEVAKENMHKMRSDEYGPPGKLNPTSMTITTKDGEEVPVTLSASIITIDGKEIGSVGVFTDMREVLKMRKELEDANIQLIQSQKIASIGRMAAGVAHEINNPLSAILLYAELLKENLKSNAQHAKDIQEIIDQTLRCKKIVSELLEFSRKSAGKASSFSLEDLINKCLGLLINKEYFQDIQVIKNIEPEMPNILGEMSQLQQVFTNLFINAADAMEGKGKLEIGARYDRSRSMFIIKVSDTGPGIPKEYWDKVFDVFFTTKPVGKGTGLGLSVSQNIVKIHGGNLSFTCPPEGGTVFKVELPLKPFAESSGQDFIIGEEPVFIGLDER